MSIETLLERIADAMEKLADRHGHPPLDPVDLVQATEVATIAALKTPTPEKKKRRPRKPKEEKEVVATVKATAPTYTLDDIKNITRSYVSKTQDEPFIRGLLETYKAKKFSELSKNHYQEFYEEVEAKSGE